MHHLTALTGQTQLASWGLNINQGLTPTICYHYCIIVWSNNKPTSLLNREPPRLVRKHLPELQLTFCPILQVKVWTCLSWHFIPYQVHYASYYFLASSKHPAESSCTGGSIYVIKLSWKMLFPPERIACEQRPLGERSDRMDLQSFQLR